jgi:hypothetical protein
MAMPRARITAWRSLPFMPSPEFLKSRQPSRFFRRAVPVHLFLLALFLAGSGFYSVHLGADRNWDLLNYHFYVAFAFLDGRLGFDIQPAQAQTYLNPLLDVPFFELIRHFNDHPRMVGFVQGAVNGINLFCVFVLAWRLLGRAADLPAWTRVVLTVTVLVIAATGADARGLPGTTTDDIQVGALVLCSIVFAVRAAERADGGGRVLPFALAAGLLAGLAFGLKPTTGPFGLGLIVLLLTLRHPWRREAVSFFLLPAAVGCLVAVGWHATTMYRMFANPVFPMLNAVFHSPYFDNHGNGVLRGTIVGSMLLDSGTRPLSFLLSSPALQLPFLMVRHRITQGISFRDLRLAIAIVLALLVVVLWLKERWQGRESATRRSLMGLSLFLLVGTYSSLIVFGAYRYLGVVEYVSSVVIVLALGELAGPRLWAPLAVVIAAVCVVTTVPHAFPRAAWSERYLSVKGPALDPDTLVVIATEREAASFLVPFFDPRIRWIRTRSNLVPPNGSGLLVDQARTLAAGHAGPMLSLEIAEAPAASRDSILAELRLERTGAPCLPIETNLTALHYTLCPIRSPAAPQAGQAAPHDR